MLVLAGICIFGVVLAVVVVQFADLLPHVAAPVHQHVADAGQVLHRLLLARPTVHIRITIVVGHVLCFRLVLHGHGHIRIRCAFIVDGIVDEASQLMITIAITIIIDVIVVYWMHLVSIDIL